MQFLLKLVFHVFKYIYDYRFVMMKMKFSTFKIYFYIQNIDFKCNKM